MSVRPKLPRDDMRGFEARQMSRRIFPDRPVDRVDKVLTRLSREKLLPIEECYRIARLASEKFSRMPANTYSAAIPRWSRPVAMLRGNWLFPPYPDEMKPERAWEEGRQCVRVYEQRCECGRAVTYVGTIVANLLCFKCHKKSQRAYLLDMEFCRIRYLKNKLERTVREVYGNQNRRIAGDVDRGDSRSTRGNDEAGSSQGDSNAGRTSEPVDASRNQSAARANAASDRRDATGRGRKHEARAAPA